MASEKQPLLLPSYPEPTTGAPAHPSSLHKHRSAARRFMGAAAVTLTVLGLLHGVPYASEPSSTAPCLSASCVHAASEILYNLHPDYKSLDPCEDTYEYICGGWGDRHDLRPDQGDASSLSVLSEEGQLLSRHILDSPYPGDDPLKVFVNSYSANGVDKENFEQLKAAYDACMDEDTIKKAGVGSLKSLLDDISGKNITETVLSLLGNGVGALASFYTSGDDRDPDSVAIFVTPPRSIGLPSKEYYDDEAVVKEYKEVLSKVTAALISADVLSTEQSALFSTTPNTDGIVDFEKELAKASPPPEDLESVVKYYNPRTLEEAHELLPQLSVSRIISALGPSDFTAKRIIVGSPEYMKSLSEILDKIPEGTLHGYFMWKAVQAYASSVEDDALKPLKQFKNKLQGKDLDAVPDRWRTCIAVVDDTLGWTLSRFFVQRAFSKAAKEFGDRIIYDIKDQFKTILGQTEWMSKDVQKLGQKKVDNIVQKIGYPTASPDIMDPEKLKQYYSGLTITNSSFFENNRNAAKFEIKREWSKLGKPTDRDEWGMTASTVNAYYNPAGNEIVFPAGIMQAPLFYDPEVPQYLSYGAFGAVSGHELSHAFDSSGRHYDEIGNYSDWWDTKTVKAFEERAQCFVDQYANFTVAGPDGKPLHVNGRLTLGENIADAGGLNAAYAAWKKRDKVNPDKTLPGLLDFTKEQLFMLNYGNTWCGLTRTGTAIQRIYQDPHSPKFARVAGTLANTRAFREAFNCPVKEPTCKLW
ncbi:endothelin-converting enzyme [Mytilinidion resinicola]|uniref:Endothelin-converting enzyme n=1 Tax=Mytilinidion resinicola TaxID=574789 RepID=A0A6A6YBB8_9PEZI|nr:endothelin-converting enzyme [Mytilinidion resinicola]KAF2806111.1 endothelin-converting enzyme [Mytilinidion resinicola]